MLVSKNACGPNTTTNLPDVTNYTPNTSRWNRGCVGYPCVGAHVGHVDSMLFVSFLCLFHSRWVANANVFFSGIWAKDDSPAEWKDHTVIRSMN